MIALLSYGPLWGLVFLILVFAVAIYQVRKMPKQDEHLLHTRDRLGFTRDEVRAQTDLYDHRNRKAS